MSIEDQKRELALDLHKMNALKFGTFTYNSGIIAPMYIDLRLFVSYPATLKKVAKIYAQMLEGLEYDRLAGVAYGALAIAGAISLELEKPWIFMRKEGLQKDHGLTKSIEGEFDKGDKIVMIEDLVTTAKALTQAIAAFEDKELVVNDAIVLLDYEKGGRKLLESKGYGVHAFVTVRELVEIMKSEKIIDAAKYKECVDFLES